MRLLTNGTWREKLAGSHSWAASECFVGLASQKPHMRLEYIPPHPEYWPTLSLVDEVMCPNFAAESSDSSGKSLTNTLQLCIVTVVKFLLYSPGVGGVPGPAFRIVTVF